MIVARSYALRRDAHGRRLRLDVAFDGLPPDDGWRVHQMDYSCPACGMMLEVVPG
jgi:hypothetical protein